MSIQSSALTLNLVSEHAVMDLYLRTENTLSDEKLVRICSRMETSPRKSIVGFLQQVLVCQHEKKTTAFTSM